MILIIQGAGWRVRQARKVDGDVDNQFAINPTTQLGGSNRQGLIWILSEGG
jgi:hypothetical protein